MSSIYSEEYQLVIKSLRAARLDKGMTQAQLAKALGNLSHSSRRLKAVKDARMLSSLFVSAV